MHGNRGPSGTLVICAGAEYRGDDTVGLLVARELHVRWPQLRVRRHTGDGAALLEAWTGEHTVVLIDAMRSDAAPGTVRWLDGRSGIPEEWFGISTHHAGVTHAVSLARALDRMPEVLLVCGIEGRAFGVGAPMSPEVRQAARDLARAFPDALMNVLIRHTGWGPACEQAEPQTQRAAPHHLGAA